MKFLQSKISKFILGVLLIGGSSFVVASTFENNLGSNLGSNDVPFQIVDSFPGYNTKIDATKSPPGWLVAGSQNVIINESDKIESRAGYELFGVASTTSTAITSDYSWRNSGATSTIPFEILLRTYGNTLEFYATSTFETLFTS